MHSQLNLTETPWGYACLAIFTLAYALIVLEERLHLRKSIPALIAATGVWIVVGLLFTLHGDAELAAAAFRHNLLDYAELMLFLLAAMTFVNTLEERQVFAALRGRLAGRGYSLRRLFWITGTLAFVISPVADNLTTALIMGAVSLAVGRDRPKFVVVACINVVVAANAGGAFSPFGDITTLMVWQRGVVPFTSFFSLFIPALVNWLVPAALMSLSIGKDRPPRLSEVVVIKKGGLGVAALLLGTIAITVVLHSALALPPVFGMMTGLGFLKVYGYILGRRLERSDRWHGPAGGIDEFDDVATGSPLAQNPSSPSEIDKGFDVFRQLERVEWDTLMFFYGVILTVGALGTLGYLGLASSAVYGGLGPTWANVLVGGASALVDNIPIMFAVLNMHPNMSQGHWLLVTMTAGVGGSLLSVGSAAGVALMGQARGVYTFRQHLRWTWAVALGYAASIGAHLLINRRYF
jgi:Na+/H+ antiporter NhaD/arsenite permease-like protein